MSWSGDRETPIRLRLAPQVDGHVQLQLEDDRLVDQQQVAMARHGHLRDVELPVRLGLLQCGSGGSGTGGAIWVANCSSTSRRPNSSSTSRAESSATRTPRRGRCSTRLDGARTPLATSRLSAVIRAPNHPTEPAECGEAVQGEVALV